MKRVQWAMRPGLVIVTLFAGILGLGLGAGRPAPVSAAIGAICPVPTSQVDHGIEVCADRGDGSTYTAGDRITICVSVNIPQIAIYPPPPPPTIRVENVAADGSAQLLIEARMASGQQCMSGTAVAPFGQETIRARAISADGKVFQEDTVTITTAAP